MSFIVVFYMFLFILFAENRNILENMPNNVQPLFSGFIVGNFTTAILYLTVTCYKLLLAGFLKSPIFHNLL